eukprot:m.11513 g.11513  ORF g.11513 m.11513 type:complete len:237 (-) comp4463_c0_seq1:111-821(-)
MPLPKAPKSNNQTWKISERKAKRSGLLKAIHEVNGDVYTGEWNDDKRDGKGTCKYKNGSSYDGDWKGGVRDGYGVYSVIRNGRKENSYVGHWVNDKKEGKGTYFYKNGDRYEGEWFEGKRSGWGRNQFQNGAVYEGEWLDDKEHGLGILFMENGNRYEGYWKEGQKHGDGKQFFIDKGQLLKGVWVEGSMKCGEFVDLGRNEAPEPTQFPIPELTLVDPGELLEKWRKDLLEEAEE